MTSSSSQVIAVTGGNRGIGAAIVTELANRGFTVGCLTRSGAAPEVDAIATDAAARIVPVACDITDEASVRAAFKMLADRCGQIDGLVNNAGIHKAGASRSFSSADFEAILRVDVVGLFTACREIYPYLSTGRGGTIINIGSFFEGLGAKGSTAYSAAKAGVGAITRCLAAEWGSKGITVLDIAPGYIETDINREYLADPTVRSTLSQKIAVGRPGRPDEVARLVAAILGERIAFLTGETITIDGGHRLTY